MKEYRTLYQRLKDEYMVKLIENKNKWQYIAVEAETALNENKFVVDLTISQLGYICDMCEVNSWDKIYTIFNED